MKLEMTRRDLECLDREDLRMMKAFVRWLRHKYSCQWVEYETPVTQVRTLEMEIGDKRRRPEADNE